jgi:two-component system response regulator FixJ
MKIPTIYIVDDDEEVRFSLRSLFEVVGYWVESFASAEEFLRAERRASIGCVIIDLRMPGMGGLQLQAALANEPNALPIIFLSGYGDVPIAVTAMKNGANDFLSKPVNGKLLLEQVEAVVAESESKFALRQARAAFVIQFERLSEREREILKLAIAGKNNKEIATDLKLSYRTVENHRSRIFLKIGVQNLLELMQKAIALQVLLLESV